jgi:hypothetical protein
VDDSRARGVLHGVTDRSNRPAGPRQRNHVCRKQLRLRAGVIDRALTWRQVLKGRLLPTAFDRPPEWRNTYWRRIKTGIFGERQIEHTCCFAI